MSRGGAVPSPTSALSNFLTIAAARNFDLVLDVYVLGETGPFFSPDQTFGSANYTYVLIPQGLPIDILFPHVAIPSGDSLICQFGGVIAAGQTNHNTCAYRLGPSDPCVPQEPPIIPAGASLTAHFTRYSFSGPIFRVQRSGAGGHLHDQRQPNRRAGALDAAAARGCARGVRRAGLGGRKAATRAPS